MPLTKLFHSPLFEHIQKYLINGSVDETVFLFVPYIKTAVLDDLLDGVKNKIVLITTWNPADLQSGSSDIDLYPFCRRQRISMYVSDRLHLKMYSRDFASAMLATGNISKRGLFPNGNHEAAVMLERLTNEDRLFFEGIRRESILVNDTMYEAVKRWVDENGTAVPGHVRLKDIIHVSEKDYFLTSALPMTKSIDELVAGYLKITMGQEPSDDPETTACIFHDLANYDIPIGFSKTEFREQISASFFAHPFIQMIDKFIDPEAYFGRIKVWVQNNCTDVPVPSRRELTGNVQVLLKWFEVLGEGKYKVDVPGTKSQRIQKI